MFFDPNLLLESLRSGDESMLDEKNARQPPPAISAIPAIFDQSLVNESEKIAGIAKIAGTHEPTFSDEAPASNSAKNSRNSENSSAPLADIFHGFTRADLEREAYPEEWLEVRDNPEALECFARSLLESRQIKAGINPDRFTALMYCDGCGIVPLPAGWPTSGRWWALSIPQVNGCRWCKNRLTGLEYPKKHPSQPSHWEPGKDGPWPYSSRCRPLTWQGMTERRKNEAAA